ncbi:MAG: hypothetical protein Q9M43_15065 [Sulfurimonas sp.]|nr:hypothetical protein [Sulfurimonas sp.]
MANKNIINKEEKDYFGTMQSPVRNRFHHNGTNDNFKTGQVCMGCHSHKKNKQKFDVCETGMGAEGDAKNCITCHMPKVAGSVSTKNDGETHSYHGFPGANAGQEMLAKYIDIHFRNKSEGFEISIYNQSPHLMLLHPLRLAQLRVSIVRDSQIIDLKAKVFVKVIGTKAKASPPWRATQVVKNTMIKAKETRFVTYKDELKAGDTLKVTLGYFLVKPKMLVKFALENNEKVKKFHILKEVLFEVKQ